MQLIKRAEHNRYHTTELIQCKDGSILTRYFKGVGKFKDNWVTVQKNYAAEIIPFKEFLKGQEAIQQKYPLFQYECVSYNTRTKEIKFESCPYFDKDDVPVITNYALYSPKCKPIKFFSCNIEILHKWLLVKDDYLGFNVQESYNLSKFKEES